VFKNKLIKTITRNITIHIIVTPYLVKQAAGCGMTLEQVYDVCNGV
jgi:hypothetical protein